MSKDMGRNRDRGAFGKISDLTNILDFFTNITTTGLILNRNKQAKNVLMFATVGMSVLAVGVSLIQSRSITNAVKKECKDVENNIRDIVLRTMQ